MSNEADQREEARKLVGGKSIGLCCLCSGNPALFTQPSRTRNAHLVKRNSHNTVQCQVKRRLLPTREPSHNEWPLLTALQYRTSAVNIRCHTQW